MKKIITIFLALGTLAVSSCDSFLKLLQLFLIFH